MLHNRPHTSIERVTFHAVVRYVQRILNVHADAPEGLTPEQGWYAETLAKLHCKAVGLTVEQVRALILTPMVSYACQRNLTVAYHEDFVAKVRDGVVVTIVPRKKVAYVRKTTVRTPKRRQYYAH